MSIFPRLLLTVLTNLAIISISGDEGGWGMSQVGGAKVDPAPILTSATETTLSQRPLNDVTSSL